MNNIKDVRKELCKAFEDIRTGELDVKRGAEMSNIAGKIINSLKVQLEYSSLRKESPSIDFFNDAI